MLHWLIPVVGSVDNRPHGGLTVEVVVAKTSANFVSAMTAPRRPLRHVSAVLASLWRVAVWSVTV
ncbi:hypothetical protein SynA1825c_02430 [Synechococcus sp. A18-25c]|nr:hypothetical protein SynA1825c_02430 [Synechococcus sp. A18-25c]